MKPPANAQASAVKSAEEEKLWEAARGMEASFMKEMVRAMRKTVPESEAEQNDRGLQIFRGMLDDHYAESAAHQGDGIGLAEIIVKQVKEMAEQQRAHGRAVIRDLNKSDIIRK